MARYYFDFRDGDLIVPDEEGLELPDDDAARGEAELSIADLMSHAANSRREGEALRSLAVCVRREDRDLFHLTYKYDIEHF